MNPPISLRAIWPTHVGRKLRVSCVNGYLWFIGIRECLCIILSACWDGHPSPTSAEYELTAGELSATG